MVESAEIGSGRLTLQAAHLIQRKRCVEPGKKAGEVIACILQRGCIGLVAMVASGSQQHRAGIRDLGREDRSR